MKNDLFIFSMLQVTLALACMLSPIISIKYLFCSEPQWSDSRDKIISKTVLNHFFVLIHKH